MIQPILDPREVSLYDFCTDDGLFGSIAPKSDSWLGWNTLFKVVSGLKLNRKEQKFFFEVSGGLQYRPGKMPKNQCWIIGRGGGKSLGSSRFGQYRMLAFNHPLAPGQIPRNIIMSPNFRSGNETLSYVEGLFDEHPELKQYVELRPGGKIAKKTEQLAEIRLKNRVRLSLMPVTRVTGRGMSTWTLLMEEAAHFKTEGRFSDEEVFKSARPSMNRFGTDAIFIIITSAGWKEGLVYKFFKKYFGVQNDFVLVIRGTSMDFNPTISEEFIRQELEEMGELFGGDYYRREYLSEFADAASSALSGEAIEACAVNEHRIPYDSNFEYFGLLDPASLVDNAKENDEFTAGVVRVERRDPRPNDAISNVAKVIEHIAEPDNPRAGILKCIDLLIAWSSNKDAVRKSTPEMALDESIELFREYHVTEVWSDRFGGEWVKSRYEDAGFEFKRCPLTKWDLYLELDPALNNREVQFVDDGVTSVQLKSLERKRGQGGRDKIDHPKGRKDDRANIVALGNYVGNIKAATASVSFSWVERNGPPSPSTVCVCGADLERGGSISASGKIYCGKRECAEAVTA